MTRPIPIKRSEHLNAGYTPSNNLSFAATMATVPVLKDELPHLTQFMGVAFQKRQAGNETLFELVGVQSIHPDRNLFIVGDGRWLTGYKPAFYRAGPFSLQPSDSGKELQLCIQPDSIKEEPQEGDQRFFDDEKTLTGQLQAMAKFLASVIEGRQKTLALCKLLDAQQLITPWSIRFKETDEQGKSVEKSMEGLYHIDSEALAALSGEALEQLNRSGALGIAYAQLHAEGRVTDLGALLKVHKEQAKQNTATAELDLDDLFGGDDELMSF